MPTPVRDIFFAPFRLDAESGRLWDGTNELAIRPKALAVLRHLAENAGRLVTVADLVHAVWADSHGSAPLVKGCVREVRKLLGDDAAAARYIETVGRRGYRFVAPIEAVAAAPASAWTNGHLGATFVGRGRELEALGAGLDAALAGTRQVLLLTGEAGVGKTALAGHFLAGAAGRHELRIARGQCLEHYGPGEPYLPVLQGLAAICRGPDGDRLLDVLGRYAPTWLAEMPPLLSAAAHARLRARAAAANPERMLREMCDAVEALAAERPLVLWLDDLQWSDPSTVDLVSALARRTERARFLLLGAYRPADVVVSEHPLGAVRRTLLASGDAHELALASLSGADVQRYVALRFPVHELDVLGEALLEITDGNPLFLASLLDELVAQRVLVETDGRWRVRTRVEALAGVVPESLRHLIERQVERLGDEDQGILEAGSAAGRPFSAGAVAAALGLDADTVDDRLQELVRTSRLVDARGLDSPPHRATSGRYEFVHALHQRVVYGRLSPARRARLHRRLGTAQATAWGDATDEIAAELASHFEQGGDAVRALRFLRVAAENAARRLASTEAIAFLTRALGLVDRLARRDRPLAELQVQMGLGIMLLNSRGATAPEVGRTYRRAADLAGRIGDRPGLSRTLRGLHRIILIRGDIARATALARKGVAAARKGRDQGETLEAQLALGLSLFYAGRFAPARSALMRSLRLRRSMDPSSPGFRLLDPAIVIHAHLGFLAWLFDDEAETLVHLGEMHRHATVLGQPLSLAYAYMGAAMLHQFARDHDAVRADTEALLALGAGEEAFSLFVAQARCCHGWALAVGGGQERGVEEIRSGIADWRATGAGFVVPYQLGLLAEAEAAVERPEAALCTVEEALIVATKSGERWWDPALLRLAGELRSTLARRTRGAERARGRRAASTTLRKAVALARRQGAAALVRRARESLARANDVPGRRR